MSFKSAQSGPDFDVASGRVLDRYQLAAAGLPRRYFGGVLRLDPVEPVRPPRAGMFLRLFAPGIEAGARGLGPVQYWYFILTGGLTTPAMCPEPANTKRTGPPKNFEPSSTDLA